ncbi:MAG: DUF4125 family protein [Treponema sp.]|nr:DUF4125 family protein [Treponema sp.]
MDRKLLIDRLADLEWDSFQNIKNIDGRAACQDNRREFDINRKSQFASWNDETLESYLQDLEAARRNARNLVWEKYARMMQYTSPLEYHLVADQLPELSGAARELVEGIVEKQAAWQEELAAAYPKLLGRSRTIRSSEDTPLDSSFETYLRCELLTYSMETLERYSAHVVGCALKGLNMNRICMEEMVMRHGYASLEAAESALP